MATYTKADIETRQIVDRVMKAHHPELASHGVKVSCLFAHAARDKAGMPKGPAVKLGGYSCAAVVSITPHKRRVLGVADAVITLDGDNWEDWSDERREALIDHELTHLVIAKDKAGAARLDDSLRPKLKMRLHDWQLGGFAEIVVRHGEESFDLLTLRDVIDHHGQILMPFMRDPAAAPLKLGVA